MSSISDQRHSSAADSYKHNIRTNFNTTVYPVVLGCDVILTSSKFRGQVAEWLRHRTLKHEIVGSSPAVRLVFGT